jgi:hypothetical protein
MTVSLEEAKNMLSSLDLKEDVGGVEIFTEKDFPAMADEEKVEFLNFDLTDLWWILIDALRKNLGPKEGLKAAEDALTGYGKRVGKEYLDQLMEKGTVKEKNVHAWTVMKARGRAAYGHKWTIIEFSDKKAIHILHDCVQGEQCFPKLEKEFSDFPDAVCWTMESVERGMIKAIHPGATIKPINRIYQGKNKKGDPHCLSIVEIP